MRDGVSDERFLSMAWRIIFAHSSFTDCFGCGSVSILMVATASAADPCGDPGLI